MNNITEHKINSLDNFICGWYQSDTTICDKIVDHWNASEGKTVGRIGSGNNIRIDKSVKNSTDVFLYDTTDKELWHDYHINFLQPVADLYCKKYQFANLTSFWSSIEPPSIQKYDPGGGFYEWHCERSGARGYAGTRHLTFMTYLNTVEDGGETEFFHQQLKIKPEKGLTLIWPADWTCTHRGVPSMTETKMIITGWYNFTE